MVIRDYWSIIVEKDFLKNLGGHSTHVTDSRKTLLEKYIKNIFKRRYDGWIVFFMDKGENKERLATEKDQAKIAAKLKKFAHNLLSKEN